MKPYEIVSTILTEIAEMVRPGVKTIELDQYAEKRIKELRAESAIKGYHHKSAKVPWPHVTCINVNNCIAHGYPNNYELLEGDIVSLDMSIRKGGQHADAALTLPVGEISSRRARLLYYAKQTTYEAIKYMVPGRKTEDLAKIIEMHAISRGFLVNRRFAGHRIGERLHMTPRIYNTQEDGHEYGTLKVGEIYCVEPMITNGRDNLGLIIDPDGWACVTADGADSAFYEHMVLIRENGPKILTTHFEYKKGEM